MKNLKNQLIRLGHTNPELRRHLTPILDSVTKNANTFDGVIEYEDYDHAPSDWMGYDVSMTYEVVTEESARHGEAEDRGYEFEDQNFETLRDVVEAFDNKSWLGWSSSNPGPRDWIYSESETDMRSGDRTTYNIFIKRDDGQPLSQREIQYLNKKWSLR